MTLVGFTQDFNNLIQTYINQEDDREESLLLWLKAQNSGHDQILLFLNMAVKRLQSQIVAVSLNENKFVTKKDKDGNQIQTFLQVEDSKDFQPHVGKYDEICDRIFEFIECLEGILISQFSYPFDKEPIEERFLVTKAREKSFIKAERWAVDNKYINRTGRWNVNTYPIRALAAFLGALIKEEVLKNLTVEEMNEFFNNRYKLSPRQLGDQIKDFQIDSNPYLEDMQRRVKEVISK